MALVEGGRRSRRRSRRSVGGGFGGTTKDKIKDTISVGQEVNRYSKPLLGPGRSGIMKQAGKKIVGKGVAKTIGTKIIPGIGWGIAAYEVGSEVNAAIERGKEFQRQNRAQISEMSEAISRRPLNR